MRHRIMSATEQAIHPDKLEPIISRAREAAIAYCQLTGKPLGVTGEIGEYEAAKILGLKLAIARTPGYDAIGTDGRRIQIKTRMFSPEKKLGGQRLGSIKTSSEFDTVMLIMLDEEYTPWIIWEAQRSAIINALTHPGSRASNERGSLAISKFKKISREVWRRSP